MKILVDKLPETCAQCGFCRRFRWSERGFLKKKETKTYAHCPWVGELHYDDTSITRDQRCIFAEMKG